APHSRQWTAHVEVHPRERVREAQCFVLLAVEQDDPHAGKRVIVEFADRALHKLPPGEALAIKRRALDVGEVECHGTASCAVLRRVVLFGGRGCGMRAAVATTGCPRRKAILSIDLPGRPHSGQTKLTPADRGSRVGNYIASRMFD